MLTEKNREQEEYTLIRAGNEGRWKANTIEVIINPTDICNFHCSYCCNKKARTTNVLDPTILENFIQDLGKRNADTYIFNITGGEPLLYPHKFDLIEMIDSYIKGNTFIKFITNGSLLYKEAQQFYHYRNKINISFHISLHMSEIDVGQFFYNLSKIEKRDTIACKILLESDKLPVYKKICNILSLLGIKTHVDGIFDSKNQSIPYSQEEIEFIASHVVSGTFISHEYKNSYDMHYKKNYTQLDKRLHPEIHSYYGMNCSAGHNTLHLSPKGIVIPCFGLAHKGITFDLKKRRLRDIPELNAPCICSVERCNCGVFIKTPKWRDAQDMPAYFSQDSNNNPALGL